MTSVRDRLDRNVRGANHDYLYAHDFRAASGGSSFMPKYQIRTLGFRTALTMRAPR